MSHFRPYIFPKDKDVVYIGLDRWRELPGNGTPLLGSYLCNEAEVNAQFDELEADLKRARARTLTAVRRCNRRLAVMRRSKAS